MALVSRIFVSRSFSIDAQATKQVWFERTVEVAEIVEAPVFAITDEDRIAVICNHGRNTARLSGYFTFTQFSQEGHALLYLGTKGCLQIAFQ
jgi:hypothetical protein